MASFNRFGEVEGFDWRSEPPPVSPQRPRAAFVPERGHGRPVVGWILAGLGVLLMWGMLDGQGSGPHRAPGAEATAAVAAPVAPAAPAVAQAVELPQPVTPAAAEPAQTVPDARTPIGDAAGEAVNLGDLERIYASSMKAERQGP
jgi:hypothetical protein